MSDKKEYSKNELAEMIVGKREPVKGIIFDQPAELGYHCPVCKYELVHDGNFDERLHWSEYNSFLWCSKCDKDFPSAICQPDVDKAIDTFLRSVHDAKLLKSEEETTRLQRLNTRDKLLTEIEDEMTKFFSEDGKDLIDVGQYIASKLGFMI